MTELKIYRYSGKPIELESWNEKRTKMLNAAYGKYLTNETEETPSGHQGIKFNAEYFALSDLTKKALQNDVNDRDDALDIEYPRSTTVTFPTTHEEWQEFLNHWGSIFLCHQHNDEENKFEIVAYLTDDIVSRQAV